MSGVPSSPLSNSFFTCSFEIAFFMDDARTVQDHLKKIFSEFVIVFFMLTRVVRIISIQTKE